MAGDEGAALHRCEQYLQGLLKGDEQMLLAWPVLSVNEVCHIGLEPRPSKPRAGLLLTRASLAFWQWGKEQRRVLVLTSQGLYRMQYDEQRASVDRYTAVSLGRIRRIERAVQGYRLILAQPDGRENPVNYLYDLFANHASSKEAQYDRMYLPRVTGGAGVAAEQGNLAAAIELTVAAIANANRLLVASVGKHLSRKQGLYGLCMAGQRGTSAAQAAGWPRLANAWSSLRHALVLKEASGEPAGRSLSRLVFDTGKHVRVEQLKVVPCVFKPGLFKPNWINQEGARRLSGKFKALLS